MNVTIVGAGIGGLTAALALDQVGITPVVLEQAVEVRELGVGLNVLPQAVAVLTSLGLLDALDHVAVRTAELRLLTRTGGLVWHEPRGTAAGHAVPQLSIHRGFLQRVLLDAVVDRLGPDAVRTGMRLESIVQKEDGVHASLYDRVSERQVTSDSDALVAADGIHSTVRAQFFPHEGRPLWNGVMIWRGATDWPQFGDGATMLIAGGMAAKFVFYPIAPGRSAGTRLSNWAIAVRVGDPGSSPPRPEDWSRRAAHDDALAQARRFEIPGVDLAALIRATNEVFEYPMCDRDPLPWWTADRATLLGDAAHPMYPVGSNGATQAILDAACLARCLRHAAPPAALVEYEQERREPTTAIVRSNRTGGPERVIDVVEDLAPTGFDRIDDAIGPDALRAVIAEFAKATPTSSPGLTRTPTRHS